MCLWTFIEFLYVKLELPVGTVSISPGQWSSYNYPLRPETIPDSIAIAVCASFGPFIHILLKFIYKNNYKISHFDFWLSYLMMWPINSILVYSAKIIFGELR